MKIKIMRDLSDEGLNIKHLTRYAHDSDACIDLVCCRTTLVPAFSSASTPIPTGIAIEFPPACFGLILPRSGLAVENNIAILGGVIDQGYRGEIIVNLINHSRKMRTFKIGERIAQLAVLPYFRASLEWLDLDDQFSPTDRGDAGHGSTGY